MITVRPGRPGWCEVTFSHQCAAADVAVVGEFNVWHPTVQPLRPDGDGQRAVTVEIPVGRTYRFRYLLDGDRWENDWQADSYVGNEFGGDDSVLDLTTDGPHRDDLGLTDPRAGRDEAANA